MPNRRYHHLLACRWIFFICFIAFHLKQIKKMQGQAGGTARLENPNAWTGRRNRFPPYIEW
jgi:hypothetical protein